MDPLKKLHYKSLTIEYKPVLLQLHRNFTTAHSTSATRTNFFIRVGSERPEIHMKMYGYGECGLPPKKPGCYMSDLGDCQVFMEELGKRVGKGQEKQLKEDEEISKCIKSILAPLKSSLKNQIEQLFLILQTYSSVQHYRAPKCCLQFSLLDLLTKYHKTTPSTLLFPDTPAPRSFSFYTASLQSNQNMLQNAKSHLSITRCIKFKYNNDVKALLDLLKKVEAEGVGDWIIVDANCSWGVGEFQELVQGLKEEELKRLVKKILYIEQPFDLAISNIEQWTAIKQKSPIKILADESFRNEHDLDKIKKVAHAVNIKTQKTGGVFATLLAAQKAKQAGLQIMFGSMCSTQLGCTQVFQFHSLAQFLDIDGALLVKEPQIQGGFVWKDGGEIEVYKEGYGLRVDAGKLFE